MLIFFCCFFRNTYGSLFGEYLCCSANLKRHVKTSVDPDEMLQRMPVGDQEEVQGVA